MKKSGKPLLRSEKSLYILSTLIILFFAACAVFYIDRNGDVAIDFPTPATRPEPNGYDLYQAAHKATVRFTPVVDPASDTVVLNPESPIARQRYSLVRRHAWLKANAKMFALVKKAGHTPTMSPYITDDLVVGSVEYNQAFLRQLARDIAVRTNTFKLENRPFAAVQSALDGIQMGIKTSRHGNLFNHNIATQVTAISRFPIEDFNVTINKLNATECKIVTLRLEKLLKNRPTLAEFLEEDRWMAMRYFQQRIKSPKWRFLDESATLQEKMAAKLISKKQIVENIHRSYDEAIKLCKEPYTSPQFKAFQVNDLLSRGFVMRGAGWNKMNEARAKVGLELLLLRLALHAYKLEKGAYPAALSDLAPTYLNSIPTDDYGADKPYFYRWGKSDYELWSVGSDGKNDNAQPIHKAGYSQKGQERDAFDKGDFVAGKNY